MGKKNGFVSQSIVSFSLIVAGLLAQACSQGQVETAADTGSTSSSSSSGSSATSSSGSTVINALSLTASTYSLAYNQSVTLSASGGTPPYTFSIQSGGGTINASSGLYTAGSVAGSVKLAVTDESGDWGYTSVVVSSTGVSSTPLSLSAPVTSLAFGQSIYLTAEGGTPPYTYIIQSGGGTINPASGQYTAGLVDATVVLAVNDTANNTATVSLTVNSTGSGSSSSSSSSGGGGTSGMENIVWSSPCQVSTEPANPSEPAGFCQNAANLSQCLDYNVTVSLQLTNNGTTGAGSFSLIESRYADSLCSSIVEQQVFGGSYTLTASTAVTGAWNLNYTSAQTTITLWSPAAAQDYASMDACGTTNWSANLPVNVVGTSCSSNATLYTTAEVVDGNLEVAQFSTAQNGQSAANRPTDLTDPGYFVTYNPPANPADRQRLP